MVKLLVYGYCQGVRSSRKIAQRLDEDVAFRALTAGNRPDFRTISDFRKIHLESLEGLFEQVLRLALESGALKLGRVALDGTKMKANASKHKAMSWKRMGETEERLRCEAREILAAAALRFDFCTATHAYTAFSGSTSDAKFSRFRLRAAQGDRRAGVRTDRTGARDKTVSTTESRIIIGNL